MLRPKLDSHEQCWGNNGRILRHGTTLSELVPTVKIRYNEPQSSFHRGKLVGYIYVIYIYIHVICIHTYMCRYTMYSSRKHRKCRKHSLNTSTFKILPINRRGALSSRTTAFLGIVSRHHGISLVKEQTYSKHNALSLQCWAGCL